MLPLWDCFAYLLRLCGAKDKRQMILDTFSILVISAAVLAILMLGTMNLRVSLSFYALHTLAIALETAWMAQKLHEEHLYWIAFFIVLLKVITIPRYLLWVLRNIDVETDLGAFIAAPISMIMGIGMLGASYMMSLQFSSVWADVDTRMGAMAAMSVFSTGVLLMLSRKIAISQIIGFLVLENGIYLFALTQTHGMPLIIEMGLLLEVLVVVMLFGLVVFRIKKSFEHIDVSRLTNLRE
jgi:hydrogenase-4 component E